MKSLLYLVLIAAGIYAFARFVPDGTTHSALAAARLDNFFEQAVPNYLRSKLSIPESPVAKRKKLIEQLSANLAATEHELEAVVPVTTTGKPVPLSAVADKQATVSSIEKARELLANSESAIKELTKTNADVGVIQQTAGRVLDTILPPSATSTACIAPQASK